MDFYTQFADHYERIFPFRPATLAFLRDRLPAGGRVLDLGCGTGHYTGALAAAGLEAIGLDLDDAMIAAARRRYGVARFVAADLGEVRTVVAHADAAFCIGNVLPHLPPAGRHGFLADLAAVLTPGATWILQTVNFDRLLPLVAPCDLPPIDAGDGLVFHRRYEPAGEDHLRFCTALLRGTDSVFSGETTLWPTRSQTLAAEHDRAGFELVEQCGGFGGDAFDGAASAGLVQVYRRGPASA